MKPQSPRKIFEERVPGRGLGHKGKVLMMMGLVFLEEDAGESLLLPTLHLHHVRKQ